MVIIGTYIRKSLPYNYASSRVTFLIRLRCSLRRNQIYFKDHCLKKVHHITIIDVSHLWSEVFIFLIKILCETYYSCRPSPCNFHIRCKEFATGFYVLPIRMWIPIEFEQICNKILKSGLETKCPSGKLPLYSTFL